MRATSTSCRRSPRRRNDAFVLLAASRASPSSLARGSGTSRRTLCPRRLACGRRTLARRTTPRARARLLGERTRRCGTVPFALERASHRTRPRARHLPPRPTSLGQVALGLCARTRRRALLCRQLHAGPAGLRQADRNGLLRRAGAVLALPDVVHFLPHELACLRRWRLAFAGVLMRASQRLLFRHDLVSVVWYERRAPHLADQRAAEPVRRPLARTQIAMSKTGGTPWQRSSSVRQSSVSSC